MFIWIWLVHFIEIDMDEAETVKRREHIEH